MNLETEVRELRARLDANDRVIEALLSCFHSGVDESLRKLFVGSIDLVAHETPESKEVMTDVDAEEYADRVVMMQGALQRRSASMRLALGLPG